MNALFALLDTINSWLNTSLLTGQAGLAGVTGGRTLVFLVCIACTIGVVRQIRRATFKRLRNLARREQPVPIPAAQLIRIGAGFLVLILVLALLFGVQASTTYYAVRTQTIGSRDVVVTLTWATVIFHSCMIALALLLSRLAVVIADVVTGEPRPRRQVRPVPAIGGEA